LEAQLSALVNGDGDISLLDPDGGHGRHIRTVGSDIEREEGDAVREALGIAEGLAQLSQDGPVDRQGEDGRFGLRLPDRLEVAGDLLDGIGERLLEVKLQHPQKLLPVGGGEGETLQDGRVAGTRELQVAAGRQKGRNLLQGGYFPRGSGADVQPPAAQSRGDLGWFRTELHSFQERICG